MEPLSLRLFGDVKLTSGSIGDIALPRKTQLLLAYLALDGGNPVPRDKLASLIWLERAEEQARHSLRQCLFTLAKSIGGDAPSFIDADRHQVSLNPDNVDVDTWRFERLLSEDTPDALRQAGALYVDDLLANVSFEDETLDAWCVAERARFRELCYEALAKLSSHYADTANLDAAMDTSRRLIVLDPLREDGHRTVMRLYSRAGRRADALRQYQQCVETLRRELGVEPEAATTRLHLEIRRRPEDGDALAEQIVQPSDDGPRAPNDERPDMVRTVVRRKHFALFAGLVLLLTLAGITLWLSLSPQ